MRCDWPKEFFSRAMMAKSDSVTISKMNKEIKDSDLGRKC